TVAYPHAGAPNAVVTLHLLDLDGGWVDVHWDRETYPYLVAVSWTELGGPLVTVLRRLQQHGLVLAIDPRTGETQVHAELADPSEQHVYRIGTRAGAPVVDAERLTSAAGLHVGAGGGDTVVIGALSLDDTAVKWTVLRDGRPVGELANLAAGLPYAPRPALA